MHVKKICPIEWAKALDTLTPGAYYLLSTIWFKEIDMSDDTMMKETKFGVSTHRLQKKELVKERYLKVSQVGKGEYAYSIGEDI